MSQDPQEEYLQATPSPLRWVVRLVLAWAAKRLHDEYAAFHDLADRTPTPTDGEPQPGDGPDYHADHAAWESRQ